MLSSGFVTSCFGIYLYRYPQRRGLGRDEGEKFCGQLEQADVLEAVVWQ